MKTIAKHLSLNEDATETAILKAIKDKEAALATVTANLTAKEADYTALKAKYNTLKQAEDARLKAELKAELNAAIKDGRIDKSSEASIKELSHESAMSLLKSLPKRKSIADQVIDPSNELDKFKRSEEHTSELQSRGHLVCRLLLEKKKQKTQKIQEE